MQDDKPHDVASELRDLVVPGYADEAGISTRAGLLRAAADEIEWLRKERDSYKASAMERLRRWHQTSLMHAEALAEIKRLTHVGH